MSRNRKKHANSIAVGSLAKWLVVAFFLCVTGLCFVYFKNQLVKNGGKVRDLETELNSLRTQNEVVLAKITERSSHTALQRHLDTGFIKMIPIAETSIVRVNAAALRGGNELRTVANEGTTR